MIKFTKSFKTPDPIPQEGIQRAVEVMRQGTLYRYNFSNDLSAHRGAEELCNKDDQPATEVAMLEYEFGLYIKHKYVIAVNSCGAPSSWH